MNILNWTKSNPISVASIFVVIAAFVAFYMVPIKGGEAVRGRADEWNKRLGEVNRFINARVEIPSEVKGESDTISPITINDDVIKKIKGIYSKINDSYDSLFDETLQRNVMDHQLLLPAVFDPKMKNNVDLPFKFKTQYREAFVQLLQPYDPAIGGPPQLNAGMPPRAEEQSLAIKEAQENYISSVEVARGTGGAGTLTQEDNDKIVAAQRERLLELLQNQALNINVYADTRFGSGMFPYQIGSWAMDTTGRAPKPHELYEGQMELWIQQDITAAIALANDIYKTDANGMFLRDANGHLVVNDKSSVIDAPYKNLKSIDIVSGYVGIQTRGGLDEAYRGKQASAGGNQVRRSNVNYSPPAEMMDGSPDAKILENFYISPTGRASNPVYDVRHVRVVADVDYQQLPKIFEAFNKINFMTVVDCRIKQVDEYDMLAQGYIYGDADCVTVDMIVETLWLRKWTREYMPDMTLEYLGLKEPSNPGGGPMMGPGMMMDGFF